MTINDFCIQGGVSEKSLYYWQKKLRTKMAEAAVPKLVQLEPVSNWWNYFKSVIAEQS